MPKDSEFTEEEFLNEIKALEQSGAGGEEIEKKIKGLQALATRASQENSKLKKELEERRAFDPLIQELQRRGLPVEQALASLTLEERMMFDLANDPDHFKSVSDDLYKKALQQQTGQNNGQGQAANRGWGQTGVINPNQNRPNNQPSNAEALAAFAIAKAGAVELDRYMERVKTEFSKEYGFDPDETEIAETLLSLGVKSPTLDQVRIAAVARYQEDIKKATETNLEKKITERITKQVKGGNQAKVFGAPQGGNVQTGQLGVAGGGNEKPPTDWKGAREAALALVNRIRKEGQA